MDQEPGVVRVRTSFERNRRVPRVTTVIAAFLALAILKPWSFGQLASDDRGPAGPDGLPAGSGAATGSEPSPGPTEGIPDPYAMVCLADETEQLVTLERWAGHEVRSWVAVSDVIVSGPLDPRLVPVAIFSTRVIGLGVCASRDQAATAEPIDGGTGQSRGPGARLLDVHSIVQTPTGPRAIDLGRPMQLTRQLSGSDPAVLYSPPVAGPGESLGPSGPDPSGGLPTEAGAAYGTPEPMLPLRTADPAPWPIGSYAIAVRFDSDDPGVVHWLRLDIIKGAGGLG